MTQDEAQAPFRKLSPKDYARVDGSCREAIAACDRSTLRLAEIKIERRREQAEERLARVANMEGW